MALLAAWLPLAAADHAQGFAAFRQLGLPDVKGAKFVELNATGKRYSCFTYKKFDGSAWLLKENPDGSADLVADYACRINVVKGNEEKDGQWKDADLKALLRQRLDDARSVKKEGSAVYMPFIAWNLILAAHAHRQGFTAEANELADLLLNLSGDPQKALRGAAELISMHRILEAYLKCIDDHDLAAFTTTLKKFSAYSPSAALYSMASPELAEQLEAKLHGQPPEISGADLTDTDRQLARELAGLNSNNVTPRLWPYWLFSPKPPVGAPDALDKILARGVMANFPLLLALRNDKWLTNSPRLPSGLIELNRPNPPGWYTRGEIAQYLLVTFDPRDFRSSHLPPTFAEDIAAWYAEHKGCSDRQLALEYLERGGDGKQQAAMRFLLKGLSDQEAKRIEELFLERDYSLHIVTYLRKRGPAAKDFLERYIKATLDSKPEGYGQEHSAWFARLRALVSGRSAKVILDDLVSGKIKWDKKFEGELPEMLKDTRPKDPLRLVLEAAVKTQDPTLRMHLANVPRLGDLQEHTDYKDNADLWEKLFSDQRPVQGEMGKSIGESCQLIMATLYGDQTELERLKRDFGESCQSVMDEPNGDLFGLAWLNRYYCGHLLKKHLMALADAIRSGKPPNKLETVPNARRKELSAILAQLKPECFQEYANTLGTAEAMAVVELLKADPKLNAKFLDFANTINSVTLDSELHGKLDELKKLKGKTLSRETLEQAIVILQQCPRPLGSLQFHRRPFLEGMEINVVKPAVASEELPDNWEDGDDATDTAAPPHFRLTASLADGKSRTSTTLGYFRLEGGALVPEDDSDKPGDSEETPEAFYKKLERNLSTQTATSRLSLNLTLRKE